MWIAVVRYCENYAPGNYAVEAYWESESKFTLFDTLAQAITYIDASSCKDLPVYMGDHSPELLSLGKKARHWRVKEIANGDIDLRVL